MRNIHLNKINGFAGFRSHFAIELPALFVFLHPFKRYKERIILKIMRLLTFSQQEQHGVQFQQH
jgi:hypothetical protein